MEKIKKSMRREDGFTLVELLAVIVILGVILAIAIPAIGGVVKDSKAKAFEQEKELVLDAARLYFTATSPLADSEVTPKTLVDSGYLTVKTGGQKKWGEDETTTIKYTAETGAVAFAESAGGGDETPGKPEGE